VSRLTIAQIAWLFLVLSAGRLSAQVIETAPSFLPGQRYELQLVQTTEDARDHPPEKTYRTPVSLQVVRKSTSGTDLDWVAGKSSPVGTTEPAGPILTLVEKIFKDLHLTVHLDAEGKYQGLLNEAEFRAKIQEFVLLLVPQATAKIQDPAERRRAADAMGKMLTPQALLSAARQEIDLYFGLSGLPLEVGKTLRIKSSALNPFGERGRLESEMEITPTAVDAARGEAIVEFRQQFDPQATNANRSGKDFSSGSNSAAAASNLTLTDTGEYVLDAASGRVKQVRHVRTIRQDGQPVRIETTEITTQ
jgi:hypothetical protein